MIEQLTIGSTLMITTIIIHAVFIGFAASYADRNSDWFRHGSYTFKTMIAITAVVLLMLLSITICTWLWAGIFIWLDVFTEVEPAVYFALVTMTTLGYGDITLDQQWRVLSGLTAVNGLLLFGLSTAFLVEFIFQIRKANKS